MIKVLFVGPRGEGKAYIVERGIHPPKESRTALLTPKKHPNPLRSTTPQKYSKTIEGRRFKKNSNHTYIKQKKLKLDITIENIENLADDKYRTADILVYCANATTRTPDSIKKTLEEISKKAPQAELIFVGTKDPEYSQTEAIIMCLDPMVSEEHVFNITDNPNDLGISLLFQKLFEIAGKTGSKELSSNALKALGEEIARELVPQQPSSTNNFELAIHESENFPLLKNALQNLKTTLTHSSSFDSIGEQASKMILLLKNPIIPKQAKGLAIQTFHNCSQTALHQSKTPGDLAKKALLVVALTALFFLFTLTLLSSLGIFVGLWSTPTAVLNSLIAGEISAVLNVCLSFVAALGAAFESTLYVLNQMSVVQDVTEAARELVRKGLFSQTTASATTQETIPSHANSSQTTASRIDNSLQSKDILGSFRFLPSQTDISIQPTGPSNTLSSTTTH
jgi:GTPase SAR1 family protein